jgi:hypothetical protein
VTHRRPRYRSRELDLGARFEAGVVLTERAQCDRCGGSLFAGAPAWRPDGVTICSACARRMGVVVRTSLPYV